MNLVPKNPAEALNISPEALEVANCYLELQDLQATAVKLNIESLQVSQYLSRREVKAYIDNVFADIGYNNRFRIRSIMDSLIEKKLEEMEESDMGSSKDISDLLALSHKMSMEILDRQIKLEESRNKQAAITNQTNVQINDSSGTNYSKLLDKLRTVE